VTADRIVAVVGLGYVGLPLALEFGRKYRTIGYDLSAEKIAHYRRNADPTGEMPTAAFAAARHVSFTNKAEELSQAEFIIVAVPTPVDVAHQPDFGPLLGASASVGAHMKKDATVVYESTVYPGATEEICIPALERASGYAWKQDFFVGYSPERINPGDQEHSLTRIVKVVAGDTPRTLERLAEVYGSIISAGVHRASSIRVAEAAKVIENTQRDLNIALMNELAILFNRLGIDTKEVLQAAGTKWNFLPFRPGLVGGHCIGVDPYYLTHKAVMVGYHPEIILAGRRINDGMAKFVAEQTAKLQMRRGRAVLGMHAAILGVTFKENCRDTRNSKVFDVIKELQDYGMVIHAYDPIANPVETLQEYGVQLTPWEHLPRCEVLVLAVGHSEILASGAERILEKVAEGGCIVDIQARLDPQQFIGRGLSYWRP
jgi:UDP-N-acetyl-D-glucosamine/UDP-N-acetyl-D-galactosamine dehydrogenase